MKNQENAAFFDCAPFAPLSAFFIGTGSESEIPVNANVLQWTLAHNAPVRAAVFQHDGLSFAETISDVRGGHVRVYVPEGCPSVLVSDAFVSTLPIVTHWNAALSGGAGGLSENATDGIGLLDLDTETGAAVQKIDTADTDPESAYTYSDRYHLFSSEDVDGACRVPGYERYIGEGYSMFAVTNRLATWGSIKALSASGFPLLYLYPDESPTPGLPCIQVVCNRIIAMNPPNQSLATILLPPFWTPEPPIPHLVVFMGFYDNNEHLFTGFGPPLAALVGETAGKCARSAVCVLWNGGGTGACRTFQRSAYDNMAELFAVMERDYGASRRDIVAAGGSRGAITALGCAGNPHHHSYAVSHVIACNPVMHFGNSLREVLTPTTPMMMAVAVADTGYKYCWRPEWREPETGLCGAGLLLHNLTGSSDLAAINTEISPVAPCSCEKMASTGTQVFLSVGTHDGFITKDSIVDFAERLRANGISLHLQWGYRVGHGDPGGFVPCVIETVKTLLTGATMDFKGVSHRALARAEDGSPISKEIYPSVQPVFFESPKQLAVGQIARLVAVGPAGTQIRLTLIRLDSAAWEQTQAVIPAGKPTVVLEGCLPEISRLEGKPSYLSGILTADSRFPVGLYLYECGFRGEGEDPWRTLPRENTPGLSGETAPILQIVEEYPMERGDIFAARLSPEAMSWGLSEV